MRYPFAATSLEALLRWVEIKNGTRTPTEPEQRLMGIVGDALDAGITHGEDVFNVVETTMAEAFLLEEDPLAQQIHNGMRAVEVHYARRTVEYLRRKAQVQQQPTRRVRVCQRFHSINLNGTRFADAMVTSRLRGGQVGLMLSKQGGTRWTFTKVPASHLPIY